MNEWARIVGFGIPWGLGANGEGHNSKRMGPWAMGIWAGHLLLDYFEAESRECSDLDIMILKAFVELQRLGVYLGGCEGGIGLVYRHVRPER